MIQIEIWSDINCPFCYIGKRHLEAALQTCDEDQVEILWRSFELDPYANPEKGVSQTDLLAQKYGRDRAWAIEMNNNMTEMAARAGLQFKMDQVIPANSFHAHRLIHHARSLGIQDKMKEELLKARFSEGLDIGDINVLSQIASRLGIDVKDILESERYAQDVRRDEEMASQLRISGVPFFVFNKKVALSGAQPVEVFSEVLTSLNGK